MDVAGAAAGPQADEQKIRTQLKKWQEQLLDLTKGNPLLGLNRSRVSKVRISTPDPTNLFEALGVQGSELRMPRAVRESSRNASRPSDVDERGDYRIEPGDLTLDCSPADLARKLRRVYDNGHTSVEERGVTTLHITFGTLSWQDDWLGESVSPLWMVPVQLVSKGPNVALRLLAADEEIQVNPALELYLRQRHLINLPAMPEEPTGEVLENYLEEVRSLVREQNWTVASDAWISTFSFETLVIYKDLEAMADLAVSHPLIAAFSKAIASREISEKLDNDLDELGCPDPVPLPLLPADSSQLGALAQGAFGSHLVVHGPPGTGKSQTISNLIADALRRKKNVLFVSSKMAALNVVYNRLAEYGLDRFCLEAHSTKAGKTKIIDELKRTLEAENASDGKRFDEQLGALLRTRTSLNSYVQELHRVRQPLGKTVYQAIGRVAALASVPEIRAPLPWGSPLDVSLPEVDQCLDTLSELAAHFKIFDARKTHPWRGLASTTLPIDQRESLETDLQTAQAAAQQIELVLPALKATVAEAEQLSLEELGKLRPIFVALSKIDRLPHDWFNKTVEQLLDLAKLFDTGSRLLAEFKEEQQVYGQTFELPLSDAMRLLEPTVRTFSSWHQRLGPGYFRWRSSVKKQVRPGVKTSHTSLAHLHAVVSRLLEIDKWLKEHGPAFAAEADAGALRDRVALSRAAERCKIGATLLKLISEMGKSPTRQSSVDPPFRASIERLQVLLPSTSAELAKTLDRLDERWPDGIVDGIQGRSAPICDLMKRTSELLGALNRIQEWVTFQRVLNKCQQLGLNPFLNALGNVSAQHVRDEFERRFYSLWTSSVVAGSEVLASFDGAQRSELTKKFKDLDLATRKLLALHIQTSAAAPAQRLRLAQSDVDGSEVSSLRRELQKRKRIKPLRKLFGEIPHALQALKPCMLMSPVSVSTYLKPGVVSFDLVVFDEASQLPTSEAIASILRAKQVVVAGDQNQLPPTSFFRANVELMEDEEDEEGSLESLLDDAVAAEPALRRVHLNWHYRSRDERLIKFSNFFFYENRLVTFPSACISDEDRGIRLEYVADGVWDRGRSRTNRREADRVAELVVDHFTGHPERSLGIVAMNMQQKELIEDTVAKALEARPDILPMMESSKTEPYFVKSLENVQGDERDTMLISVGYGKDLDGHLSLNFGPLNREGGWRRLNVLVTRAKWQTILVTSMRSQELSGLSPGNRGPITLRDFISYGERRCELPQPPATPTAGETNDFEDSVTAALRDRGLTVDQQVGASKFRIDLAIRDRRDSSRYVLGIECDGATYHSTRTARDRDILRQQVLESMGWRIHRVWSTDWFHDRDRAIQQLLTSYETAQSQPIEDTVQAVPLEETREIDSLEDDPPAPRRTPAPQRRFKSGQPYEKSSGTRQRELLLETHRTRELAAVIEEIVAVEGPIHDELLAERLKERCGIERAGSNVQSNIARAIQFSVRHGRVERRNQRNFLWEKDVKLTSFRALGDGVKRPLDWIHPTEVALAIQFLVEDQFGIVKSHLGRAVGKLFGLDRVPTEASDYITQVADELVKQGQLRDIGGQLHLAS